MPQKSHFLFLGIKLAPILGTPIKKLTPVLLPIEEEHPRPI